MIRCRTCGQEKPESEFSNKNKGKLSTQCKACANEYARKYYSENKGYRVRRKKMVAVNNRNHYRRGREKLDALKDVPCADCGKKYPPYVLDFHHIDPSLKSGDIPTMLGQGYSWGRILEEVEKCVLVCANCHRIRHRSNGS